MLLIFSNIFFSLTVKANYKMKINYDIVKGKDGKDHWKITSHDSTANPERLISKFENLFNGNKVLCTKFYFKNL